MRICTSKAPLIGDVPGVQRFEWAEAIAATDGRPPYDAIVELWFAELKDVRAAISSSEARQAEEGLVDFVDFAAYQVFLAEVQS